MVTANQQTESHDCCYSRKKDGWSCSLGRILHCFLLWICASPKRNILTVMISSILTEADTEPTTILVSNYDLPRY